MKKQIIKKRTKKFGETESVVKNKESESVISNKECGDIAKNNDYGITLIALVITVIVLLILARHLGEHAQPAITAF